MRSLREREQTVRQEEILGQKPEETITELKGEIGKEEPSKATENEHLQRRQLIRQASQKLRERTLSRRKQAQGYLDGKYEKGQRVPPGHDMEVIL